MGRGRDKFKKYKPIINVLVKLHTIFPKKKIKKMLEKRRKTSGMYGLLIRYIYLKILAKSIGDNVSIHPDVYLFNVENLSIGNNVSIHPMCYIEACGGIDIGDDVSIAHGVTIMSTNHIYDDLHIPIKDQGLRYAPVYIKNNVWIGSKATVLAGNTINDGVVVGAGAVVTHNIERNTIVAGVPAKVIKIRE